jgi:aspartyl-tRNA(Asn)/glutamyl-tRNA(Gln) amidotransferase subunit B
MAWEIVVGIETHAQLATRSKIFSGASTAFGAAPNTQASAIDLALPGVLPVLNKAAVKLAIRFGLAVGGPAVISRRSVFARKNYFYPDLPKGYQISQYELPVVTGGALTIALPEGEKTIRLTRAHLEEDAGKSLHELPGSHAALGQGVSGIDLNRAGTPLLEIVSEPELRGAREAAAYARTLHALVRWIGICDGNMQEGSFRCDANVSVRRVGDAALGTRCEIKNLNSFRFMEQAIEFEARRQIEILEEGGRIVQETRLYDPDRDETRSMRSKEDAQDYRYFPDPDLLPLVITEADIEAVRAAMPELPAQMRKRFEREHGLSAYDAAAVTASKAAAEYFEATVRAGAGSAKLAANWIMGELAGALNEAGLEIERSRVSPAMLAGLLARIGDGTINSRTAKAVFESLWSGEADSADAAIEKKGLKQISDAGAIEKIVDEAMAANPKLVEDYRSGREKAFNALVGQVMKRSQGKANPAQVNDALRRRLAAG